MRIEVRQIGDVSVLDLNGRCTVGEGDVELRQQVRSLLSAGHCKLVLNLAEVDAIDSAGIGEIVACVKRAAERNGELKLLHPGSKVSAVLQLIGLGRVFESFGDERSAVSSFR